MDHGSIIHITQVKEQREKLNEEGSPGIAGTGYPIENDIAYRTKYDSYRNYP